MVLLVVWNVATACFFAFDLFHWKWEEAKMQKLVFLKHIVYFPWIPLGMSGLLWGMVKSGSSSSFNFQQPCPMFQLELSGETLFFENKHTLSKSQTLIPVLLICREILNFYVLYLLNDQINPHFVVFCNHWEMVSLQEVFIFWTVTNLISSLLYSTRICFIPSITLGHNLIGSSLD